MKTVVCIGQVNGTEYSSVQGLRAERVKLVNFILHSCLEEMELLLHAHGKYFVEVVEGLVSSYLTSSLQ